MFMKSLSLEEETVGDYHFIDYDHVYSEVINLYEEGNSLHLQFPMKIKFLGQEGVDLGGVCREINVFGLLRCCVQQVF